MNDARRFETTTGRGHGFAASGRISPYFEGVEQAGGRGYRKHGPTYVPWLYPEDGERQYRAVTEGVTLWDTACERQVQVRGKRALEFVDRLVTRDMRKVRPGRCTYTFVCDQFGVILCDPVLLRVDEETIWLSQSKTDLFHWMNAFALNSELGVEVTFPEVAPLQVQGPKSRDVLRKLCGSSIDGLAYFGCVKTTMAGIEAVISRTGWTGELGYEIYPIDIPAYPRGRERGMRLWNAILAAGEEYGILVTPFLWDRGLESGLAVFDGSDVGMNPLEFWRDTVVDFDGGDFIGKQALMEIRSSGGPARKMVGLVADNATDRIQSGEWDLPVLDNGIQVGTTRRYGFSPTLDRAIAMALVARNSNQIGKSFTVVHPGGEVAVKSATLPFIDVEGKRVRS
jgi:aminomethyltransferase